MDSTVLTKLVLLIRLACSCKTRLLMADLSWVSLSCVVRNPMLIASMKDSVFQHVAASALNLFRANFCRFGTRYLWPRV